MSSIEELLENNKKSKETAFYYILAKKLTREGFNLPTFFGNSNFDPNTLKPLNSSMDEAG